jgi:transcriptional regulator with XRE-family HTH domain
MERKGRYIPNTLKGHRRLLEYTQEETAFAMGFQSAERISRWEKGVSMPSYKNIIKLCILFDTTSEKLYPHLRNDLSGYISVRIQEIRARKIK